MSATAISTVVKMMETLPDQLQDQMVQRLREYLDELQDEAHWDEQFKRTQPWLAAEAARARREVAAGQAEPMDLDRL